MVVAKKRKLPEPRPEPLFLKEPVEEENHNECHGDKLDNMQKANSEVRRQAMEASVHVNGGLTDGRSRAQTRFEKTAILELAPARSRIIIPEVTVLST
jgi:hypothetical protein